MSVPRDAALAITGGLCGELHTASGEELVVAAPGSAAEQRLRGLVDLLPLADWCALLVDELHEALDAAPDAAGGARVWMPLWPAALLAAAGLPDADPVLRILRSGGLRWIAGPDRVEQGEGLAGWLRARPELLRRYRAAVAELDAGGGEVP